MKDLSKLGAVKAALEQVVKESDVNNGTQGLEMIAHFWQNEYVYDSKREELQTEIARKLLSGDVEAVKGLQKKLEGLPKPKIIMEFRLLTPIPRIQGTKTLHDGEKQYKLSMENVTSIFIHEDSVALGLLEYEETKDVAKDAQGRDAQIIKLHLKKGIIDVAAPIIDRYQRLMRPKRAYVNAISYKAMQTAGELMNREMRTKRKLFGYDEQNQ